MTRRVSYDAIARNPWGVRTMTFDTFMERALSHFSAQACACPGECLYCAAQSIMSLKRIVEHPDDCPECAKIHEARSDPGVQG